MGKKARNLFFYLLGLLLFLAWSGAAQAGFGISPPYVRNGHLIPGSHYDQRIFLLRSSAEEDLQAEIEVKGEPVKNWISIDKGTSFILPKGKLRVPMIVSVDVPKEADVGTYKGHISIKVKPLGAAKTGVSVALGARVDIDLTVTNETYPDFIVRLAKIPDFEELKWPWNSWLLGRFFYKIRAELTIENTGNVPVAPSKVHLDVYDISKKNLLESSSDTSLKKIKPFSKETIVASFPTKLGVGQYWSKLKIYKGNQVVNYYEFVFNIVEPGALGKDYLGHWPWILGIGLFLLVALFVFILVKVRFWRLVFLAKKGFLLIFAPPWRWLKKTGKKLKKKFFQWLLKKAKDYEQD